MCGRKEAVAVNELEEICLDAYESSKIYKDRMKRWYNKLINRREFREGVLVLLFNSIFKLFPGKLCTRWLGPLKVLKVYPHRAIKIGTKATDSFKVKTLRSW